MIQYILSQYARFKSWRFNQKIIDIQTFAEQHRNFFVIVCDPRDDSMFAAFHGKQVTGIIRSEDGVKRRIVKDMLRDSTFKHEIDRFLGAIAFSLQIKMVGFATSFFNFIDGAAHGIAKALKKT